MIRLVMFDLDGTILLSGGAGSRAFDRAFKELHGLDRAFEGIRPDGKTDPEIAREIFRRRLERTPSEEELRAACERYIFYLKEEVPVSAAYRLMPGIPELFSRLERRSDIVLGLATGNLLEGANAKLGRSGLARCFRFGGYGSDSESRVELVRVALERGRTLLGSPPAEGDSLMVGDTVRDIKAARAVGVSVLAVATGSTSIEQLEESRPDYLMKDLSDTEAFLTLLENG